MSFKDIVESETILSVSDVSAIGISLINSLEILHDLLFIHGDIKPDNIIFGVDDQ